MDLLSDRARPVALPTMIVACVLLCVWWLREVDEGRIGRLRVLDEPAGTEVVLSLQRVLSIDGPDRYTVGNAATQTPIQGPSEGLDVGQDVTIGGVVGEGLVVESWRRDAPGRPAKRALGLVGLALGGVLAAGSVRGRPGRWRLRG